MRYVIAAFLSLGFLSACAFAQTPCPTAGEPRVIVTQVQEAGSGDWHLTAAELVASKMKSGTAVVVQTEIDGALVDVIVWVWRDARSAPQSSTPGWKVERFFSMIEAAARYDSLAVRNSSTRLVSSPWGGEPICRQGLDGPFYYFAEVAWIVYYEPGRQRAVRR